MGRKSKIRENKTKYALEPLANKVTRALAYSEGTVRYLVKNIVSFGHCKDEENVIFCQFFSQ